MQEKRDTSPRRRRKKLTERARREISENLRSIYDAAINDPLPERLTRLLDELETKKQLNKPLITAPKD